jgi:hypothetical protein
MGDKVSSGAECARRGEDFAGAVSLCRQLRAIFESTKGGAKDPQSLHRIRELCAKASRSLGDSVYRDRLSQLQNFADALFSDRRNQAWARNRSTSGVPSLRDRSRATLDAIERRLDFLISIRKRPEHAARRDAAVVAPLRTT